MVHPASWQASTGSLSTATKRNCDMESRTLDDQTAYRYGSRGFSQCCGGLLYRANQVRLISTSNLPSLANRNLALENGVEMRSIDMRMSIVCLATGDHSIPLSRSLRE
ncbi:hypothetical protein NX059_004285 [Plenodomus lindquistii]|nr:hypothetical protein NX059_004285 [Plenodomus lindquistii]